jgi:STE24 endopeptidase
MTDANAHINPAPTPDGDQPPILEGDQLRQAREREQNKVMQAVTGLILNIALLVAVTVSGTSSALRDALGGNGLIPTILFILVFQAVTFVMDLPFEVYFGYILGKRYGLLKQQFGGWFLDNLKNFAVGTVLFGVLFLGLYTIFRTFPTLWFPLSLGLIVVVFGVLLFLSPKLARLNHKSSPMNDPDLEARIRAVFDRANVKLTKVSKLEVSEKTKGMNASLSPDGLGTEVLITDTLLHKIDPEGVEVVLAHELGHKVHRDVPALVTINVVQIMVIIAVAQVLFSSLGTQFGLQGASDIATLPLFALAFTVIGQLGGLAVNAYMRRMEYRADRYALQVTRNPAAFERAFRVLAAENLSDPNPPAWVEFWLHNHPTIEKRVAAARAWATSNPS